MTTFAVSVTHRARTTRARTAISMFAVSTGYRTWSCAPSVTRTPMTSGTTNGESCSMKSLRKSGQNARPLTDARKP
eukprot:3549424-Prorocentrum_lima.AAC.1